MEFHICELLLVLTACHFTKNIASATCISDINLNLGHARETLVYNGASICSTCEATITSPPGTILKATFLDVRIPEADEVKFFTFPDEIQIISMSNVFTSFEPVFSFSSGMRVEFTDTVCGVLSSTTYLEAEFTFLDDPENITNGSPLLSTGGHFYLDSSHPTLTLQSTNMTSINDLSVELDWYITARGYDWLKIDILSMEPGKEVDICVFDTFNSFGTWVCMTDTVLPSSWYSYGEQLRIEYYAKKEDGPVPGAGMTMQITVVDPYPWSGQPFRLAACNPNVTLEDIQSVNITSPFYLGNSSSTTRFQCRMKFRSRDGKHPKIEHLHYDHLDVMKVYTNDDSGLVNLAEVDDATIHVNPGSPLVSISPNDQLSIDLNRYQYSSQKEDGIMLRGSTVDPVLGDYGPIQSLGVSTRLNDTSSTVSFTTPGYPDMPPGELHIWWMIWNDVSTAAVKLEFTDFDIDTATLFVHVAETPAAILEESGSVLPDDVYADTRELTVLIRSEYPGICRGVHFNVTLITLIDECMGTPCGNGGTCVDEMESFRCVCPTLFTGDTCQERVDVCLSAPCRNGAVCNNTADGYSCACLAGFTGQDCESAVTTLGPTTLPQTSMSAASTSHQTSKAVSLPTTPTTLQQSTDSTAVLTPTQTTLTRTSKSTDRTTKSPPTTVRTEPRPVTTLTSTVREEPTDSKSSDPTLIIALSVSLTLAFALIVFLVCVVVYRSGKKGVHTETSPMARDAACSPVPNLPARDYSIHNYEPPPGHINPTFSNLPMHPNDGPFGPDDKPPAYYTTIPDKNQYMELDPATGSDRANGYMVLDQNSTRDQDPSMTRNQIAVAGALPPPSGPSLQPPQYEGVIAVSPRRDPFYDELRQSSPPPAYEITIHK